MRRLLSLIFLAALAAPVAPAACAAEPGEELTVYMLTMEPGDQVFEKFGHNAIWIHDAYAPPPYDNIVYHWGIFEFDQERFFIKYALGQMDYSMGGFPLGSQIEYYQGDNRKTLAQELNLTPAQRLKLRDFLRWNELPENATYRYNYYTDNCSTRVRDAIDNVVGDAIEKQLKPQPTDVTFRWHTRRLTRDNLFWFNILNTALGPATDKKINAWEECFLPLKLRDHFRDVTIPGPDGTPIPLVKSEKLLATSTRPPEPAAPPRWTIQFFLAGLVAAGGLFGLHAWARRRRGGQVAFVVAATLYTLLLGIFAAVGLWFWFASDHWAAWRNENLFGYSPLAIPLVVLLPFFFRRHTPRVARVRKIILALSVALAATTLIGCLLSPVLPQDNAEPMAFVLPINLVLAWCVWRLMPKAGVPTAAPASAGQGRT